MAEFASNDHPTTGSERNTTSSDRWKRRLKSAAYINAYLTPVVLAISTIAVLIVDPVEAELPAAVRVTLAGIYVVIFVASTALIWFGPQLASIPDDVVIDKHHQRLLRRFHGVGWLVASLVLVVAGWLVPSALGWTLQFDPRLIAVSVGALVPYTQAVLLHTVLQASCPLCHGQGGHDDDDFDEKMPPPPDGASEQHADHEQDVVTAGGVRKTESA